MTHTRHFLTVGQRQLHYRHAGTGKPLLLLHACPKSSLEQAPLLERLARNFSVYAFDIPGYGDSDPVSHDIPEIEDFADDAASAMNELGIDACSMYGRHTGGLIALEFGRRHPRRLNSAIFDGFPIFSDEERRRFLSGYLQPLVPMWDGLHLPGLWARIRENYLFFPWNEGPEPAHRNDLSMPAAYQLHATAVDMLKIMDRWRLGYASAFRYHPQAALTSVNFPAMIMARRDDLLYPHLARLPDLPDCVSVEAHSYDVNAWADRIESFFKETVSGTTAPVPPRTQSISGRAWSEIIKVNDQPVRVRRNGTNKGDILILHDIPGSSALEDRLANGLAKQGNVVVPDLPGIGLSAAPGTDADRLLALLAELVRLTMTDKFTIIARGLSARLGIRLAQQLTGIKALTLIKPLVVGDIENFAQRHIAAREPDNEGTHLTRMWYSVRDGELYWPWFERTRESIRYGERQLDPAMLNSKVVAMAENPNGYGNLVEAVNKLENMMDRIPDPRVPVTILHDDDVIGHSMAEKIRQQVGPGPNMIVGPGSEAELSFLRR